MFIAVEEANGEYVSGSGFNVSPSGLVVTNRHVVQDAQGRAAKRVRVIFDNTRGAWKSAHVIKVSQTDELAFIKVDDAGSYPVVAGVARQAAVRVGTPVALMGYPLGTSTAGMGGDINKLLPKSTLGLGTVSKIPHRHAAVRRVRRAGIERQRGVRLARLRGGRALRRTGREQRPHRVCRAERQAGRADAARRKRDRPVARRRTRRQSPVQRIQLNTTGGFEAPGAVTPDGTPTMIGANASTGRARRAPP